MTCKRVTDRFAVAPQLSPEALPALVQDGFSVLVCNRPDGEEPGQPSWSVIAAAAQDAGIQARHIPIAGPQDIAARKDDFAQALAEMPGPVLAFCRTGTRCTIFTQLPVAFCGGSTENSDPVAAPMLATRARHEIFGYASTRIVAV